jgi:tRNA(Ile)-lysidine synthase
MQHNDLDTRLSAHLRDSGLFPDPGLALLAVSGGPDSVALLDLMVRLAPEFVLSMAVVHVDHGIAEESADVAEQVLGLAVLHEVPGYLSVLHLGAQASETRARRARYQALRAWQRKLGARYLVTGHHADDQMETVLFRLLRGTGLAGLAGIAASGADGLVRPLLPFRKVELERWVADHAGKAGVGGGGGLAVHMDPANVDHRHHRSWIRGRLLPLIRERFGAEVDGHLLDVARHAAADGAAWAQALRVLPGLDFRAEGGWVELSRDALLGYEDPLAVALIRAAAREAGCVVGPRRAARLWAFAKGAPSGRRFELGQRWIAETAFGSLRIGILKEPEGHPDRRTLRWGEGDHGRVRWGRWEIRWSRERAGTLEREAAVTWVTEGSGEVRGLLPGDRILPLGGTGHRRVSRVLMEQRVPRSERRSFPLLTRGDSVIWLPGVCRSNVALPGTGETAIRLEVASGGES